MQGGDPLAVPIHQHIPLLPETCRLARDATNHECHTYWKLREVKGPNLLYKCVLKAESMLATRLWPLDHSYRAGVKSPRAAAKHMKSAPFVCFRERWQCWTRVAE